MYILKLYIFNISDFKLFGEKISDYIFSFFFRTLVVSNAIKYKINLLELMAKKLDTFEVSISQMRPEIDDIKETQDKHIRIIDKQETHHHNVEGRLRNLENSNRQLEA
jgi:septal ring factor EnvC (AmiA/AmiB activator)